MYIKIFESRQSSHSYVVHFDVIQTDNSYFDIKNEAKETVRVKESDLFKLIDRLFKDKENEKRQSND